MPAQGKTSRKATGSRNPVLKHLTAGSRKTAPAPAPAPADFHPRLASLSAARLIVRGSTRCQWPSVPNGPEMTEGPQIYRAAGNRRRRRLILAQFIDCQHLEFAAGLNDRDTAIASRQVQLAVSENR